MAASSTRRIAHRYTPLLMSLVLVAASQSPSIANTRPGETYQIDQAPTGRTADRCKLCYPWKLASSMSANGRFIAFTTNEPLLPEDRNVGQTDIYIKDLKTGSLAIASVDQFGVPPLAGNPEPNGTEPPTDLSVVEQLSWDPSISGSGRYVTFTSKAPLVLPDTNAARDVFVFDARRGAIERVSDSFVGAQAELSTCVQNRLPHSFRPSIDKSGRYVAFVSLAEDLILADDNCMADVFVRDMKLKETARISVSSKGEQATCSEFIDVPLNLGGYFECVGLGSNNPSISPDGRFVAFDSIATNLISNDANSMLRDVFIHDLKTHATEVVSTSSDGSQTVREPFQGGSYMAWNPNSPGQSEDAGRALSDDGRYVAFYSTSNSLVPNDPARGNGLQEFADLFVKDRKTGRTERLSVEHTGESFTGQNATWDAPAISSNGRYVVMSVKHAHFASNVGDGINDFPLIFRHDRQTGSLEMVTRNSHGERATDCRSQTEKQAGAGGETSENYYGDTTDGRFVTFLSCAANLQTDPDPEGNYHTFIRDMGSQLGVGGLAGATSGQDRPVDDSICVGDVCIPPGAAVTSSDATDDISGILTEQGANLYASSLANRPVYQDLFAVIALQDMPQVLPGLSPIFYGLRFEVGDNSYEVRATSFLGGSFGLFDCTLSPACMKVADLEGGYGTTGERVVFSLPLDTIGLQNGGELSEVEAFSALGSSFSGATKILDTLKIK